MCFTKAKTGCILGGQKAVTKMEIKAGDKVSGFFMARNGELVPFVGVLVGFDAGGGVEVVFETPVPFAPGAPLRNDAYFSAAARRDYVQLAFVESAPEGTVRQVEGCPGLYSFFPA